MNLYELNNALVNFNLEIDEETGEILNAEALDALELERNEKIENLACWSKNLLAEAEALKAEEKALKERRAAKERKVESLHRYIQGALNGERFETAKCKISYRKSEAVNVSDVEILPAEYVTKITELKANKSLLKKALKAGEVIDGAVLEVRENMSIK